VALRALAADFPGLERSPVYESPAQGYPGPPYWNLCVTFPTGLSAEALVARLKALERSAGRSPGEPRLAPKTLDADLLLLGDEIRDHPPLPHPDLTTRAYVLGPMAALAPTLRPAGMPARLERLWADMAPGAALRRLDPDPLEPPRPAD
jgi:2-amino-4-hydroxy-6-hydroxymethyldihydropteridine diphosphokinase